MTPLSTHYFLHFASWFFCGSAACSVLTWQFARNTVRDKTSSVIGLSAYSEMVYKKKSNESKYLHYVICMTNLLNFWLYLKNKVF